MKHSKMVTRNIKTAIQTLLSNDLTKKTFLIILLIAIALKLIVCALQVIEIFPNAAPLDDELMLRAAKSIGEGNWLGAYSWDTMAKHMFFSVWLWLLHTLHIPYLIGGQLLYLLASIVSTFALSPVLQKRIYRLVAFIVLWFSPYSTAQFTLRVYIDNIYPSLCLLFFAGVLGVCLRAGQRFRAAVPYAVAAGFGAGLAWLTKDDAIWIVPFGVCAGLFYLVSLLLQKENSWKQRAIKVVLPLFAIVLGLGCVNTYKALNYKYYGRYIVSDYTSAEFKQLVGSMVRADVDTPHKNILVCKETRQKLYAAVPLLAELGEELENGEYYNGYGNPETKEFNSAGFVWSVRRAAYNAGFADTPQKAEAFYTELARQINDACDSGRVESNPVSLGTRITATLVPFDRSYLVPTLKEFGHSLSTLLLFRQTSPLPNFSYATIEDAAVWREYTYTQPSYVAKTNTAEPYFYPHQWAAAIALYCVIWVYRIAIWFALFFGVRKFFSDTKCAFRAWRNRQWTGPGLLPVLLLGVILSALLRIAMISYIEVSSFCIGTYLLYLAPAGAIGMLFLAYGAVAGLQFLENYGAKKSGASLPGA